MKFTLLERVSLALFEFSGVVSFEFCGEFIAKNSGFDTEFCHIERKDRAGCKA